MKPYVVAAVAGIALFWRVATASATAAADPPAATDLTVDVTGFETAAGDVRVALYDGPDSYEGKKPPLRTAIAKIADGHALVLLGDLPSGSYAIALYHDRNGNGKLDRSFLGKPTEPYGFSNNVRRATGRPPFEDARFTLPAAGPRIGIRVE
jgi:uncharacterized protein (DUF2141 family)